MYSVVSVCLSIYRLGGPHVTDPHHVWVPSQPHGTVKLAHLGSLLPLSHGDIHWQTGNWPSTQKAFLLLIFSSITLAPGGCHNEYEF